MPETNDNFYLESIPQSEYRRINSKRRVSERQLLKLDVSALTHLKKNEKEQIKQKILTEVDSVFHALLSDETIDGLDREALLNPIFKALGI